MAELPIVERLRGRKDGDVALTCREVIEAAELIEKLYDALKPMADRYDPHGEDKEFADWVSCGELKKAADAIALAEGEKQG